MLQREQLLGTFVQQIGKNCRPREARALDRGPLGESELCRLSMALVGPSVPGALELPDGAPASAAALRLWSGLQVRLKLGGHLHSLNSFLVLQQVGRLCSRLSGDS